MKNVKIEQEVVRSKGDYVVGRVGTVISIDSEKRRAQVKWKGQTTTWVSFDSIEPTSIPYEIVKTNRFPKYQQKQKVDTTWYDVFTLPEHYTEVSEVGYMGRGTHSVHDLENIVENYAEVIHQLRVKMQNAIQHYSVPQKLKKGA